MQMCRTVSHLLLTSAQIFLISDSAMGTYASYSSWTTFFPSKWSLVVPEPHIYKWINTWLCLVSESDHQQESILSVTQMTHCLCSVSQITWIGSPTRVDSFSYANDSLPPPNQTKLLKNKPQIEDILAEIPPWNLTLHILISFIFNSVMLNHLHT